MCNARLNGRLQSLEWMISNQWHWTFALEDKIETLFTILKDLFVLVDFLILGVILLLINDWDKLLVLIVLVIFLLAGLVTFSD